MTIHFRGFGGYEFHGSPTPYQKRRRLCITSLQSSVNPRGFGCPKHLEYWIVVFLPCEVLTEHERPGFPSQRSELFIFIRATLSTARLKPVHEFIE